MSNQSNKAGFVPAQAAADISALDFTAASEALASAFAAAKVVKGDVATETVADVIAECADRLISIPTANPAQIAEKVSAFAWLNSHASQPFSDRETRLRIADTGSDASKGLLAIYLDLIALDGAKAEARALWDNALAAYEAAAAERDRLTELEDGNGLDMSAEWDVADRAVADTLEALLNTRAPDGVAMGLKARLVIERAHVGFIGDDVSDPAFISGMLADTWDETALASLYQDGLALAGIGGPVVEAKPDTFDGEEWLEAVEAETGSRMVRSDDYSPRVHFEGGDVDAANASLGALRLAHAGEVERAAYNRAQQEAYAAAGPVPERIPSTPEELQGVFARGLINTTPEAQREQVTAALASLGIAPVVWTDEKEAAQPFDPAAFVADLLAADMTVGAKPGGGLTDLLYNGDKPRHANADAMRDRFNALTASERADLSAHIAGHGK